MIRSLGLALLCLAPTASAQELKVDWSEAPDRTWIGPEFWANRLQDWRVRNGRLECLAEDPRLAMRTVHVLTHRLQAGQGAFSLRVELGLIGTRTVAPDSAAGFLLGVGGEAMDWRAAALVHGWAGRGGGLFVGLSAGGELFVRDNESGEVLWRCRLELPQRALDVRLVAFPRGDGNFQLDVFGDGEKKGEVIVPARRLVGGVALVSHPGSEGALLGLPGSLRSQREHVTGRWWFEELELFGGDVIDHDSERTFGPIAGVQYTLSRDVLKLTVQMLPIGPTEERTVSLQMRLDWEWWTFARAEIVEPGFTATFRHEFDGVSLDWPYRVVWGEHEFTGTIRRDPVEKDELVLAGLTGNHNNSRRLGTKETDWTRQVWFPHPDLTERIARHEPDLLFFSGDQVYEGRSPTFADIANIELDYLYKWYLWCWAWRDLTRDVPSVTIPDDHDVYQGNVWGQGGRQIANATDGGYVRPAGFVKMVERTQTSHLPDPFDPTPIEQGIGSYHTSLLLGRVDFAVLEDRKFKSGPGGKGLPPTGTKRADHVDREDFDPRQYDRADLVLLGERQLCFLEQWAADWRGAEMKAVLSQSPLANLATHHGAGLQYLRADLDSNGWPPSGRDRALRAMRKAFAFHVAGDQHLATLAQHGIDAHGDASWSFAVPSVANFYSRAWRPEGNPLGEHLDGLGNRVTLHAVANPGDSSGREPAELHDNIPGYGIVRMNLAERSITFECWPRHAHSGDAQYPGWPRTIRQTDNYAAEPPGWLPEVRNEREGLVVQVLDESSGALVHALRLAGKSWRPPVLALDGTYTIRVGDPEADEWAAFAGIEATREPLGVLESGL